MPLRPNLGSGSKVYNADCAVVACMAFWVITGILFVVPVCSLFLSVIGIRFLVCGFLFYLQLPTICFVACGERIFWRPEILRPAFETYGLISDKIVHGTDTTAYLCRDSYSNVSMPRHRRFAVQAV